MTPQDDEARDAGKVQSVDRAISILAFLAQNGWSGATEVGDALDVHKSTALRLLTTLEARGLVERRSETGQFHLGFGLVHLARGVIVGPDIAGRARPDCEWLAEKVTETVTLSVMEADLSITVDQILADSAIVSRSWLGRSTPLHCTSSGKVFLAHLAQAQRSGVVNSRHERYTEHTIVEPKKLFKQLNQVLEDGFAMTQEEFEDGLSSIAAPVFAGDGTVIATIDVSGPSYRLDENELVHIAPTVLQAARQASERFGGTSR